MRANGTKWVMAGLLVVSVIAGLSLTGSATTAAVKTTGGRVLQGVLSGLAPMLRLEDPIPHVGPAAQFAIPLDSIQQMWIDFPRVVIETAEHVIVGPYSAFAGIAQLLKIGEGSHATEVPFTAVQAIAFNGASFEPLPREWLSRGWLNQMPNVMNKTTGATATTAAVLAPAVAAVAPVETSASTDESEEVVWNGVTPEVAPTTSSGEFPWWTALAIVGALLALFLFLPTNIF
jgi:hypothetical protein